MQNKHTYTVLSLFCFCILLQRSSIAQTNPDQNAYKTENAVVVYAGGGLSFFTGKVGTPAGLQANVRKQHAIGSLRLMWHPGNLLHAGFETGWVRFYSYTIDNNGKKGKTETAATPILLVLSMPVNERLHVFGGTGIYLMRSRLDYNTLVESKGYNLGWMLATSYYQPLTKRFGLAGEVKWMDAAGTRDALLSLQVQLRWRVK